MSAKGKIVVLSSFTKSLFWFRLDMMKNFMTRGYEVLAVGDAPEEEWFEHFQQNGIRYRRIPVSRNGLNPFSDLKTYCALRKLLSEEKPKKVFTYQAKTIIYGLLAAHNCRITEVYPMIAGLGSIFRGSGLKNKIVRTILRMEYRFSLRYAKKIIFQNQDDIDCLVESGVVDSSKCFKVNGSGVDTQFFVPMPLPQETAFLMTARLLRDKGLFEYLKAAQIVKRQFPETRFLLVGPYDTNPSAVKPEELQEYIDDNTIVYLGELADVRIALKETSVFALPSYHEGTPKTVLEAMSCGRAIITTDAPGCRETVKNGINGYLVPVKNVTALAEIMTRFVKEPSLTEKLGNEGRKLAEERFDVRKVNAAIAQIMVL